MTTWVDEQDQSRVDEWLAKHGEQACADYYTDDPRFAFWMRQVDLRVMAMVGINIYSLEDWLYHDAYADGATPREVARDLLAANGWATA